MQRDSPKSVWTDCLFFPSSIQKQVLTSHSSKKSGHHQAISKNDVLRRIEEDRERVRLRAA